LEKGASKEAKKKAVDKAKDVAAEIGKQVLKNEAESIAENKIEKSTEINKNLHANGIYKKAPYHGNKSNSIKNKAPNKGQEALDNSISIGDNTTRRIGISDGEIVVFDETSKGIFHGHVRLWDELTDKMKAVLRKSGLVNKKGKIIK